MTLGTEVSKPITCRRLIGMTIDRSLARQFVGAPQHGCAVCIGGQTTVPYEQKTQQ